MKTRILILLATLFAIFPAVQAQEYSVDPVDFNTPDAEFSAVPYRDGVIFISNRSRKRLSADADTLGRFYTDIYFSRKKPNGKWSDPVLFSEGVTGFLNEGPATFNREGTVMYYTANIEPKSAAKKRREKEFKLGIFKAEYINGAWKQTEAFPFNSSNQQYNMAHPSLSANDSVIYFASNMPGGIGGADIYKCVRRNGMWSQPINLGNTVNTRGDELFPFISASGKLYFSSNGYDSSDGFDIYFTYADKNKYSQPVQLPYPVNTPFDDFGYVEARGGSTGFFSSNRGSNQNDDVFTFLSDNPALIDCNENTKASFCYYFEDENLQYDSSLPIAFEWHLGDGTVKRGKNVEHCYETEGYYQITLDLIDTLTQNRFYSVSQGEVMVKRSDSPYIDGPDGGLNTDLLTFRADGTDIFSFDVEEYYWVIDDSIKFSGPEVTMSFSSKGWHEVVCGAFSRANKDGIRSSVCTYKKVYVSSNEQEIAEILKLEKEKEYIKVNMITIQGKYEVRKSEDNRSLAPYYLILKETPQPLASGDPVFTSTEMQVTELKTADGYVYVNGPVTTPFELYDEFNEAGKEGMPNARIERMDHNLLLNLNEEKLRTPVQIITPGSELSNEMKNTYQVIIATSVKPLNADDKLFTTRTDKIRAYKTPEGWVYTAGAEATYESITPTFNQILESNQHASVALYDGQNFTAATDANTSENQTNSENPNAATQNTSGTESDIAGTRQANANETAVSTDAATELKSQNVATETESNPTTTTNTSLDQSTDITAPNVDTANDAANTSSDYFVVLHRSPIQLSPTDPFFKKAKGTIREIAIPNGYAYAVVSTPSYEESQVIFEEHVQRGYENAEIATYSGKELNSLITGEQLIDAAETTTYNEFDEEEDREFRILIKSGTLPTDKHSLLPEGSKYKVSEVKRDGTYYYTTATTGSIDMITPIYGELTKQGLTDLEIVENDGKKFIVVTPEKLKSSPAAAALPNKTFTQQTPSGYYMQLDQMPTADQLKKLGNSVQVFQTTDPATGQTLILAGSASHAEELSATQQILSQQGIVSNRVAHWNQSSFEQFENIAQLNDAMALSAAKRSDNSSENTDNPETSSTPTSGTSQSNDPAIRSGSAETHSGEALSSNTPSDKNAAQQSNAVAGESEVSTTSLYHIVIGESDERIPFNDPRFSQIEQDIVEMEKDGKYIYVTGASHQESDLQNQLSQIQSISQYPAHIQAFEQTEVASMAVRTGRYLGEKNADALNIEFSKLSDIKFEYNSAEIKEESKRVLDYISAMLILEEDFLLRIQAHTCSQGTDDYNQNLSELRAESVRNYFTSRGIDPTRLLKRGFGESRPMVSNDEEDGRKQNRRVEFIILFPGKDQSQWTRSK